MLSAVKALKDIKINYLTFHISSGLAALKAVKKISGSTRIVGVTTLTSLNNNDLKLIGYNKSVKNLVAHQANLPKKQTWMLLVCSPYEVSAVRKIFKKSLPLECRLGKKITIKNVLWRLKKLILIGW